MLKALAFCWALSCFTLPRKHLVSGMRSKPINLPISPGLQFFNCSMFLMRDKNMKASVSITDSKL